MGDAAELLARPILFVELRFLWIFAVVFGVHWALRSNFTRKLWLLVASHAFYGCFFIGNPLEFFPNLLAGSFSKLPVGWWFPSLLWLSTLMDYRVGLGIEGARSVGARRAWLLASLTVNLGVLGFFKYYGFFAESVLAAFAWLGLEPSWEPLRIFLPYGISFYTFQSLSYSIEVYRRRLPAERSFLNLAFFIAFFPQVVAGPIVRAMTFLPQTREPRRFAAVDLRGCATLFLVGFVKKACVADGVGGLVDTYFTAPQQYDGASAWAALACYAIQVYCDFSGYSDMAIAIARLLGYELCLNFDFPFMTGSVAEYWRRWHISLSTWLRDYLFIPLGGSRGGELFTSRNLMLTMLLGGLWHGAGWNYVAWGGLHGLALVAQRLWERRGPALGHTAMRWLGVPLTFAFVVFAFVPFRVSDVYVDAATSKPLRAHADGFYREYGERLRFAKRALEREPLTGDWRQRGGSHEVRARRELSSFAATRTIWEAMLVPGAGGPRRLFRPPLLAVLGLLGLMHWLGWRRWLASWWRAVPAWSYAALLGAGVALALFLKPVAYRAFIYFQF